MLWIDIKYSNLIGAKLIKFKIKNNNPYVANYNCPFCDDIKEKRRSRGYLLEKKGLIFSYCHNCGMSMTLNDFINQLNPSLHQEYKMEILKEKWGGFKRIEKPFISPAPIFKSKTQLNLGIPLSQKLNNAALTYALKRKIPSKFYDSLFYLEDINILTQQLEKYKTTKFSNEPVLVIPFFTSDKEYSYINCRAISSNASFRYYILEINTNHPKIWGLEFIDWNKPVFVLEGPIDAMSIPNALAMAGMSSNGSLDYIISKKNKKDICFVYDSDCLYNKEVSKHLQKRIKEGFSVVIYDKNFSEKDINEVICNDLMTPDEVYKYIQNRTFHGLRAQIEFSHQIKTQYS